MRLAGGQTPGRAAVGGDDVGQPVGAAVVPPVLLEAGDQVLRVRRIDGDVRLDLGVRIVDAAGGRLLGDQLAAHVGEPPSGLSGTRTTAPAVSVLATATEAPTSAVAPATSSARRREGTRRRILMLIPPSVVND